MATVPNASHSAYSSVARRSYIPTEIFTSAFFTYTVSLTNEVYSGAFAAVTSDATKCPAGRILHETGKKLYPGANPDVNQYMVSVFDPVSMLTGFINPNNPIFSLMNTDRPAYINDSVGGSGTGGLTDSARANALYTRGDVLAGGRFDLSGSGLIYGSLSTIVNVDISGSETVRGSITSSSTINAAAGVVTTAGQVRGNSKTNQSSLNNATITINSATCQVHEVHLTGATVGGTTAILSINQNLITGGVIYIFVINDTANNRNVDFGASFRSLNAGVSTVLAGRTNTYSFFSDGGSLFQIGQCGDVSQV